MGQIAMMLRRPMRPMMLLAVMAGVVLMVEAQQVTGHTKDMPLWLQDMKKHDKFVSAMHDQEELSQQLGVKAPKLVKAEKSLRTEASNTESQQHNQPGSARKRASKMNEDHDALALGEAAQVEESYAGHENEGEISRSQEKRAEKVHSHRKRARNELGEGADPTPAST